MIITIISSFIGVCGFFQASFLSLIFHFMTSASVFLGPGQCNKHSKKWPKMIFFQNIIFIKKDYFQYSKNAELY